MTAGSTVPSTLTSGVQSTLSNPAVIAAVADSAKVPGTPTVRSAAWLVLLSRCQKSHWPVLLAVVLDFLGDGGCISHSQQPRSLAGP